MSAFPERSDPALICDLMWEALRVRNDRLNEIAIELFGRLGKDCARRLIQAVEPFSCDGRCNITLPWKLIAHPTMF